MPRPKQHQNEILHIDAHVVVYKEGWPETPDWMDFDEECIRRKNRIETSYLLKIGTNETNPLQPIAEYVKNCPQPWGSSIEGDDYRNHVPSEYIGRPYHDGIRTLSTMAIVKRARIIHFLARLALAAKGDKQSYGILADEGNDTYSCTIPLGNKMYGEWIRPEILQLEGTIKYMDIVHSADSIHVTVSEAEECGIAGAARSLLASLANVEGFNKYWSGAGSPVLRPDAWYCEEIIRSANDGSLTACPACGWPVLKLTPKASSACRHSHLNKIKKQQRIETARKTIEQGGTVAEAAQKSGLTYGQVEYQQRHQWEEEQNNGQEEVTRMLREWFGFRHHLD